MPWNRTIIQKSSSPAMLAEWDEILRRRKVFQPACQLTAGEALDSQRHLQHFDNGVNRVTVSLLDKPGGRKRIEGFATPEGQNARGLILAALHEVVTMALADGASAVYWYDATPEIETEDTHVYGQLATVLNATSRASGRFTIWEVTA